MMTLERAKKLLLLGVARARELGRPCSIAVVDENGWLVALHRMDGAPIPSVDIARDKAWTAAAFRLPTSQVSRFGHSEAPGAGLNAQNWNERLTTIPGGLPIWDEGQLVGAIGICGGTPEEDASLCQAIIEALS